MTLIPESLGDIALRSRHACQRGEMGFFQHDSAVIGGVMRFSVFLPPAAANRRVPALLYLAGLTCTEETFMIKAGAQSLAAELGIALIAPDTSPRDRRFPGDEAHWDFGIGAGFYVDATEAPWRDGYRMFSYVCEELPGLVERVLPVNGRWGVCGHSMGGHGALVAGLRHPERFRSVSAFAPIAHPSACPWGRKAFSHYLGADRRAWAKYDATELVRAGAKAASPILIDQGMADPFLAEQLYPEAFAAACDEAGVALSLRRHPGYDHGYYFIATYIDDHLRHHARFLA